jgi:polysaccharide biosynthesis protein PslE
MTHETHKSGGFALETASIQRNVQPSGGTPEYAPALTLRSVAEACFRHRLRLACFAGLPVVLTILLVLFTPKMYEATMQLVVLNTRQYSVISSESDEPSRAVNDITETDVNSQAGLLHSRDVLNQALDQLGRPSSPMVVREKAIGALDRALTVTPLRDSNILNVSYVDSSPMAAKDTLQAIASSFVERELALFRPTHNQQLFIGLVEQRRRDLNLAQDKFAKFKVATGIASLGENENALLRQIESSSSQSASLAAELALQRRSAEKADDELAHHPERITTQNRSTPNQAAVESLTSLLVQLENKRTSLLNGYQPTERIVQDIEQQISNVQKQISQMRASNAVETVTDMNPLNLELKSQLARAQISSAAVAAQRLSVDAQKRSYLSQLNQLEEQASEFESLQKEVAEGQRNLDSAIQKRDQAAVDDALDRDRILNVAFAAKPSASSMPVAPRPRTYFALGIFTAMFLGIGACILSELGRKTVYSPAELDALTGLTTVACVPLQKPQRHTRMLDLGEYPDSRNSSHTTIADDMQASAPLQPLVARSKANAYD